MTQILTTLQSKWWMTPEYQGGSLDLPGQSTLSPIAGRLLEELSQVADAGGLDIPPMPKAAMEAVKILRGPDADIEEVVKCIQVDPGMTLNVLRHANSAHYGCRHRIDSLRHAVIHVGMRRLKSLILEVAMRGTTSDMRSKEWTDMEWRYSLYCANISRFIAKRQGIDEELGYLAGLLHDIGRLPVLRALERRGALNDPPVKDCEQEIIVECLHRGVGRQVAKIWELPPAITDAITAHLNGRHEDEEGAAEFPSTKAAEAASDLCHALGLGRARRTFAITKARSLRDVGFDDVTLEKFLTDDLPVAVDQVMGLV